MSRKQRHELDAMLREAPQPSGPVTAERIAVNDEAGDR